VAQGGSAPHYWSSERGGRAERFLREYLSKPARLSTEAYRAGAEVGLSKETLKHSEAVHRLKKGRQWYVHLVQHRRRMTCQQCRQ
jgi:hypothetical protein